MSDVQTTSSNSTKILLIVVAAVAALALIFFFVINPLLFGGDDAAVDTAPVVGDRGSEKQDEPAAEPEPEPVPETFEVFSARDPFHQLVSETSGGTTGGTTTGGTTGGTTTGGTGTTGSGTTVSGTNIKLVDVFTAGGVEKVQVTVNDTGYDAAEGETFAGNFKVLDISGSCATFLYGDSRFVLCKGDEIRK